MINLLGKHYAKDQGEAINLLREHGEDFAGFYRVHRNGVLFMNRTREPFACACLDTQTGGCFFVNATRTESGIWYNFSTDESTEKKLGIDALKYSEQTSTARDVIRQANVPMYKRFYSVDEVTA